jgi:hypothetical protein
LPISSTLTQKYEATQDLFSFCLVFVVGWCFPFRCFCFPFPFRF